MKARWIGLLLLCGFAVMLTACAQDEKKSEADRVSTIPWNRPEKWEGQGALGGFSGSR